KENGEWRCIDDSVPKPHDLNTALCEYFIPFNEKMTPAEVKIEAYGMGGIGICHVEADGHVPCAITAVDGTVENPANLLADDVRFAWFGNQSTHDAYFNDAIADTVHAVIMTLSM
ncbi:MAG: hypothetical protein MJ106_07440, partial [Lentisphaeria bacterium]|nr:hypothetical protein [Lentisphaeria bacterium]